MWDCTDTNGDDVTSKLSTLTEETDQVILENGCSTSDLSGRPGSGEHTVVVKAKVSSAGAQRVQRCDVAIGKLFVVEKVN